MKTILCMSGSLREASSASAVLRAVTSALEGEARFEFADIGELPHYNADLGSPDNVATFIKAVGDADGVLFVTPEYNYSVPGVLKNAIDWASRPAYQSVFKDKPAFVISVSGGALGGVRAQAHLKYILNAMLAKVFPWQEVVVPHAPKKTEDGVFKDENIVAFASDALKTFIASL
jgi:chromate reductase